MLVGALRKAAPDVQLGGCAHGRLRLLYALRDMYHILVIWLLLVCVHCGWLVGDHLLHALVVAARCQQLLCTQLQLHKADCVSGLLYLMPTY